MLGADNKRGTQDEEKKGGLGEKKGTGLEKEKKNSKGLACVGPGKTVVMPAVKECKNRNGREKF